MKSILFSLVLVSISTIVALAQDIVVTNYNGGTTFAKYEEFQPKITVQNTGIIPINTYFNAALYLSADAIWDTSDKAIAGTGFPASLGAGQVSTAPIRGAINASPGTYYLIVKVDHDNRVTETDESNNLYVIPNFVITPSDVDFKFTSISTNKTSYPLNGLVTINYVIENLGSTNTGGHIYIHFALSTDNILDSYDHRFMDQSEDLTGPDVFLSSNNNSIQPFALPPLTYGNYFILAKVDYDIWGKENFIETNESNNLVAIPITIKASNGVDFIIEPGGVSVNSTDYAGWTANLYVKNIGTTDGGGYKIGAQLIAQGGAPNQYEYRGSVNEIYDNTLMAGETKSHYGLTFSTYLPPGTYYAAYKINYDGLVSETETSNNVFIDYYNPIVIPPKPVRSVQFNSLTMSGIVDDTDKQVNLNINLTNTGNIADYSQKYTILLKDASNTTVHTQQVTVPINFGPAQTVSKTITLTLANPLAVGTYQITASCLSPILTSPAQISGTITITPTQYVLTGTVKGEDGTPLTSGKLFLYQDNGTGVKFIQKITPYTGPSFSFSIDNNPHTLYFIPDPVVHSDYVPTIYGKTMILKPESFFTTSSNITRDLEVLKITPTASGSGVINGQVTTGGGTPTGRVSKSQTNETVSSSSSSLPVVLMSDSYQPLRITYTDANGFYEFKNLGRNAYYILVCTELDGPGMSPLLIDITDKNLSANFDINSDGVSSGITQLYLPQDLTLSDFATYQYGDSPILLQAESDTEIPIEYSTSDASIATIVNNQIQINGVGSVVITASQNGSDFYLPASVQRTLTINKADQSVTMNTIPLLTYGDAPLLLEGISSSGLEVTFKSSDPDIASITGNIITIHSAGSVEITAEQSGNELYNSSLPISQSITIDKATQNISFDALSDVSTDIGFFELSATASSDLTISFESSNNEILSIEGNMATIHADGVVFITAYQSGNKNYYPAAEVTRELRVNLVLSTEEDIKNQIYPNPTLDVVFIDIPDLRTVEVTDALGRVYKNYTFSGSTVDLSALESGMYFIGLTYGNQSRTVRIMKR